MEALKKSKLQSIQMIGRRGATQASFSTKEIKDLCSLSNMPEFYIVKSEWDDSLATDASKTELLVRGVGRRTEFLGQKATMIESHEQYLDIMNNSHRKLILRFLRKPVALVPNEKDKSKIGSVEVKKQKLVGEAEKQEAVDADTPD